MCVNCKHELAWLDLVPVLSWVFLRGRCRYCKKPISWQYPAVELLTAASFVISYTYWPFGLGDWLQIAHFGLWLVILTVLVILAVYDFKWMLLPDQIVFTLISLVVMSVALRAVISGQVFGLVFGALAGLVAIGGLFYGLFVVSRGKWIGGGDVKLAFAIGPLVGSAEAAVLVVFIASLLGSVVSVPLLFNRSLKMASKIPFGPFLIVATIIVYLFGSDIFAWYGSLLV